MPLYSQKKKCNLANVWLPAEIYLAHLSDSGRGEQESEEYPWVLLQLGIIKQKPSVLRFLIKSIRPSVLWLEVRGHVTTQSCQAKETDVERERTEHTGKTVAGRF